jgi:hypothetical protein
VSTYLGCSQNVNGLRARLHASSRGRFNFNVCLFGNLAFAGLTLCFRDWTDLRFVPFYVATLSLLVVLSRPFACYNPNQRVRAHVTRHEEFALPGEVEAAFTKPGVTPTIYAFRVARLLCAAVACVLNISHGSGPSMEYWALCASSVRQNALSPLTTTDLSSNVGLCNNSPPRSFHLAAKGRLVHTRECYTRIPLRSLCLSRPLAICYLQFCAVGLCRRSDTLVTHRDDRCLWHLTSTFGALSRGS